LEKFKGFKNTTEKKPLIPSEIIYGFFECPQKIRTAHSQKLCFEILDLTLQPYNRIGEVK
jgi:hypothetical protein